MTFIAKKGIQTKVARNVIVSGFMTRGVIEQLNIGLCFFYLEDICSMHIKCSKNEARELKLSS